MMQGLSGSWFGLIGGVLLTATVLQVPKTSFAQDEASKGQVPFD